METVKNLDDISNLKDNRIIGTPEFKNSTIQFRGVNNILVCDGEITLRKCKISFNGNNSIIYLSYTDSDYHMSVIVRNNSTIYIGKNNKMGLRLDLNIQEHQNLIIGDDCIIGNNIKIRTCDAHPIYSYDTKERVNYSQSIIIGDHVWIDHFTYISKGVKVGSGAIVGLNSFLTSSNTIHSNDYVEGNPVRLLNKNVFFTKDFMGTCTPEETVNFSTYKSDVYKYEFVENETLALDKIDKILKDLTVDDRLEFIKKLFVRNKLKNRFYI